MKTSRICALALLVMVASTLAFADGIQDPKIIVKGAGGDNIAQGKCPQCVGVGFNFSFTIPESGSGALFFTNDSGKSWNSLKLVETGVPAADVSCHSSIFASCTVTTLKDGAVQISVEQWWRRPQQLGRQRYCGRREFPDRLCLRQGKLLARWHSGNGAWIFWNDSGTSDARLDGNGVGSDHLAPQGVEESL